MSKKILSLIGVSIVLATFVYFITTTIHAISSDDAIVDYAAPSIFSLRTVKVTPFDNLRLEKTAAKTKLIITSSKKGRYFTIEDNGATDSYSLLTYPNNTHEPSVLKLSTTSNLIKLCLYNYSQQKCGHNVQGTRDVAGDSFTIYIADDLSQVEKIFIETLQKRINIQTASLRLDQSGLSQYKEYLTLLNGTTPKDIENYSVSGEIDGNRFIIEGVLSYNPVSIGSYAEDTIKLKNSTASINLIVLIYKAISIVLVVFLIYLFIKFKIIKKKK